MTQRPSDLHSIDAILAIRHYLLAIVLFLALAYSVYVFLPLETIKPLVQEDGLFEYTTATCFFLAAIFYLGAFLSQRNIFLLLLSIIFFIGAGEEISWGQRIFAFTTPEVIAENNVQGEFTLHNMELFNAHRFDGARKTGLAKLLTINFLYKLFWLSYCILLPITVACIRPVWSLAKKIKMPIPPLAIGIFFLINWSIFRVSLSYLLLVIEDDPNAYEIGEVWECCSAFIFMILGLYFLNAQRAASTCPTLTTPPIERECNGSKEFER